MFWVISVGDGKRVLITDDASDISLTLDIDDVDPEDVSPENVERILNALNKEFYS